MNQMRSREWRSHRRAVILLGLGSLFALILAGYPIQQPGTMDSYYYYESGRSLLENRAFVEPYIWNYLEPVDSLPAPSHLYWMPLPSILVALSQALLGTTFKAAQVPFLLLAAGLPIVSYLTSWGLGRNRRHAIIAGGLTILSGFYVPYWTLPETFAPFAIVGSLALFSTGQWATSEKSFWLLSAGILAGLGHLCRADGLLVILAIILMVLVIGWQRASFRSVTGGLLLVVVGYLLIMAPWFARNWHVIGAPLSTAGTKTIFMRDYDELFSYGTPLTLRRYLDWGWQNILYSKLVAAWTNLQTFVAVNNLVFLTPLTLIGLWQCRRRLLIWPTLLYGFILYSTMTMVFTFPGIRGGLFHSSAALLPVIFAAAVTGLDTAVDWISQRRPSWHPTGAKHFFRISLLVLAAGLTTFIYNQRTIGEGSWSEPEWNRTDAGMIEIDEWLAAQQGTDPVVMVGNPPAWYYHSRTQAIVIPNENVLRTLAAARRYGASYLILDRNHPRLLSSIYQQTERHPALELAWDEVRGAPPDLVVYRILGY